MSDSNSPPAAKPNADQLGKQLQAALAKRRPTPWKPVLAVLLACTALLGLLAWWLYPSPPRPLLQVLALDDVCTPEQTPTARAQLYAPDEEAAQHLARRNVLFQGLALQAPGGVKTTSDAQGRASATLVNNGQPVLEFFVKHYEEARGLMMTPTPPMRGRVFVWPSDARLLIVDADETMPEKNHDPEALAALKKADADGWRIIYLAASAAQADAFHQVRSRLEQLEADADLPAGPILGRGEYPSTVSAEQARRDRLKDLSERFTGPKFAVIRTAPSAALCAELRWKAIVIGDAKTPANVVRVPTWASVPEQLK